MIKKVLIANRGEIAVRIIRALREMEIASAVVFSEADRDSRHVRQADEAYCIGQAPSPLSYLDSGKVIDAAKRAGVDAVHPGYGFLSENAVFARRCIEEGLIFIGPRPEAMEAMGTKTRARQIMAQAGVPVVPGTLEAVSTLEAAEREAEKVGYPIMLKASAGGGGKGMRLVNAAEEIASAFRDASSEAEKSFGDGSLYIEKAIVKPRHIEVQVLCDGHGHAIHLGERECSIQRRHQKIVEEAPSPIVNSELRAKMGEIAITAARAVDYINAGTIEFLVTPEGDFYFMEMNTRLQVEHAVTEAVTGIDIVKEQVRIADGETLGLEQKDVTMRGWAIECRIYAEDPMNNFLPCPGKVVAVRLPGGPCVRVDSSIYGSGEVSIHYDPMIAKVITWGADRREAIEVMRRALEEFQIVGIRSNRDFLRRIIEDREFQRGEMDTGFIARNLGLDEYGPPGSHSIAEIAAAIVAFESSRRGSSPRTPGEDISAWRLALREGPQ